MTLKQILEAVLFASEKPLPTKTLLAILKGAREANPDDSLASDFGKIRGTDLETCLQEMKAEGEQGERGFLVAETAGGWQVMSHPACGAWVRQLFPEMKPSRLSPPAMETLAIVAYRQPITKADIEAIRGVAVDGVLQTLLDRGLVRIAGRAEVPGRPLIYETTQFFMEHFALRSLDELPNADELRRAALPSAETAPAENPADEAAPPELPLEPAGEETSPADETVPEQTPAVPDVQEPPPPEAASEEKPDP